MLKLEYLRIKRKKEEKTETNKNRSSNALIETNKKGNKKAGEKISLKIVKKMMHIRQLLT